MANNPNFHGYGADQENEAKVKLGKRKFDQYSSACTLSVGGGDVPPPPAQNNLPLRTANDHNWSDEVR